MTELTGSLLTDVGIVLLIRLLLISLTPLHLHKKKRKIILSVIEIVHHPL